MHGFQAHPGCWQNPAVTVGLRRLPPCWLSLEAALAPWGLCVVLASGLLNLRASHCTPSPVTPLLSPSSMTSQRKSSAFWAHVDNAGSSLHPRFMTSITSAKSLCHVTCHCHRFWGLGYGRGIVLPGPPASGVTGDHVDAAFYLILGPGSE